MSQALNVIHPDAKIGENVIVSPFTTIAADVVIGDGTWIGPNVTIMDGARIGKNCKIFPGAVVSGIPQDLKYAGEPTTAEIGDNTVIRECVTVNKGTTAKGKTVIGKNCLIMAYVHVAHDCLIGNNCILVNNVGLAGEVEVEDFVIIGGMTAVHQFSKIGTHAMVGGVSKIRKDVPPFIRASKDPLSYVGINSIGLRRRGLANETIYAINDVYRIIYQQGLNTTNALKKVEETIPQSPERDHIIEFIKGSKRGIIKGWSADDEED
jgi:UDP-N-acetylglucosamine acyltransferase